MSSSVSLTITAVRSSFDVRFVGRVVGAFAPLRYICIGSTIVPGVRGTNRIHRIRQQSRLVESKTHVELHLQTAVWFEALNFECFVQQVGLQGVHVDYLAVLQVAAVNGDLPMNE